MKLDTNKILLIIGAIFLVALALILKFKSGNHKPEQLDIDQLASIDVSGEWNFEIYDPAPSQGKAYFTLSLKQNKSALLGTFMPKIDKRVGTEEKSKIIRGSSQNGNLNLLFLIETSPLLECIGKALPSPKEISGTCKFNTGLGFANQADRVWRAIKVN